MSKRKDVDTVDLQSVQSEFEHWRHNRAKQEPIPERLWELVRALLRTYSIGEIAKGLNLSHGNIKKHIPTPEIREKPASYVDFVDLGFLPPSPSSCTLELTNPDGKSMKLSITGTPCIDVMELTQVFLGDCT